MRTFGVAALLVLVALAGCADEATGDADDLDDFGGDEVAADADSGGIRGVVVDRAITPVADATVSLDVTGETQSQTTDSEGRFTFGGLPPGTYILEVSKPAYETTQTSVEVVAGDKSPPVVKVQIDRLFDSDPFLQTQHYEGHVGCAYNFFVSSTCVNDYTRIDPTGTCPGGCLPFITGVVDQREFRSSVDQGWQSIVWEMAWESSASGTAEEMQITVSYEEREGAGHWFASTSMGQPFRMQVDVGVPGPNNQVSNGPELIDPEGRDDLWNMISAGSGNVVLQQNIEVFQTNFYYAPSPEGWSLVAGDGNPF